MGSIRLFDLVYGSGRCHVTMAEVYLDGTPVVRDNKSPSYPCPKCGVDRVWSFELYDGKWYRFSECPSCDFRDPLRPT